MNKKNIMKHTALCGEKMEIAHVSKNSVSRPIFIA
jgi:hypothetical protein